MTQKGSTFVYIVVLVLLVASAAGVIFFMPSPPKKMPSPQPAKSLKNIYQDSQFGFQFEYPGEGFEIVYEEEAEYFTRTKTDHRKNFSGYVGYEPPKFLKGIILKPKELKLTSQFDPIPLTLWIFENPQRLNTLAWFKNFWYYPFIWGIFAEPQKSQIAPKDEATISGIPTYSAVISYRPGEPQLILLPREDKIFLFMMIDQDDKVGNKAQESFRFQ